MNQENGLTKGEIAHNDQFLRFSKDFLFNFNLEMSYLIIFNCCLLTLSIFKVHTMYSYMYL